MTEIITEMTTHTHAVLTSPKMLFPHEYAKESIRIHQAHNMDVVCLPETNHLKGI